MKVIKIGAVWCSGCLVMVPRWKKLEKQFSWLKTQYYDFDKDTEKIKKYNVEGGKLPTFIFFDKKGNEFLRKSGEISEEELAELVTENKNK